jgi:hypothetical protein
MSAARRIFRPEPGDRGALHDPHPEPLHDPRQPADEPTGVDDGRGVGRQPANRPRDPDPGGELVSLQKPVSIPETEAPVLLKRRFERRHSVRPARQQDLAALVEARVEALRGTGTADLVHSVVGRLLGAARRIIAVKLREPAHRDVEVGRAPRAVPPRRPEPGHLALDDHDPQRRVAPLEVVRGPQAREPGAEDRDVRVRRAIEGRPRGQVVARRLQPEGHRCRITHGSRW